MAQQPIPLSSLLLCKWGCGMRAGVPAHIPYQTVGGGGWECAPASFIQKQASLPICLQLRHLASALRLFGNSFRIPSVGRLVSHCLGRAHIFDSLRGVGCGCHCVGFPTHWGDESRFGPRTCACGGAEVELAQQYGERAHGRPGIGLDLSHCLAQGPFDQQTSGQEGDSELQICKVTTH